MTAAIIYGSVVGLSLGLTGGGGSIFAVPFLVYGLGLGFRQAVAVSLGVVGLTALYGAVIQARRGHVLWGAGAMLGLGGIAAAPLGAWIGSRLPEKMSLVLFAVLMAAIGLRMLVRHTDADGMPASWISCRRGGDGRPRLTAACAAKLLAAGGATGVLAGIFGVGGGFLVVPALLLVACVSIERALATSLVGIFLVAASGFAANASQLAAEDLAIAGWFMGGSILGMTLGSRLKTVASPRMLQTFFGLSVLATAAYVVIRNL